MRLRTGFLFLETGSADLEPSKNTATFGLHLRETKEDSEKWNGEEERPVRSIFRILSQSSMNRRL